MATVHMPANAVHRQMLLESSEKRNLARTIIHCNCQQADFPFTDTPHGRDLCNAVKSMLEQYGGDFALWSKGHQVPLQGPMLPSQISHSVEVNVGIMTKWMWKCTAMAWNTASSLSLMVAHFKTSKINLRECGAGECSCSLWYLGDHASRRMVTLAGS